MDIEERRFTPGPDRRRFPRGGRRATDLPGRHPRVIVADSYEGARRPCLRYLNHFNFDVVAASDGQALVDEVVARSPAVILMDSQLEKSSRGLIGATPQLQTIPVILFVGGVDQTGETGRMAVRVAASLVKPFPLALMLETIRGVLRAQSTAALASQD